MPDDVYAAMPRQNGKAVCLRFLSERGCSSRDPDRCTSPYLVHVTPAVPLKPIAREHIEATLGGVRKDVA